MKKACPCLAAGKYFPSLYAARQNGYKNVIRLEYCIIVVSTFQQKKWVLNYFQRMYHNVKPLRLSSEIDTFRIENCNMGIRTVSELERMHSLERGLRKYTMLEVIQATEPWNGREF